ncbi:MAG: flagellar basal body rod protein FlgC [Luminiphilus sp.]|jgi:flagellar basal-body rod protein FlgC|nr:flagellar basal body rod protein FlgC [Luminiphilus sp.]
MSMDQVFQVAGSALAAQLVRMNTTASNLANASNTATTAEEAYRAKRVTFRTLISDEQVSGQMRYAGSIQVGNVVDDPTPSPRSYDPGNPSADADGYVYQSNVNEVSEMVEMTAAARSYRNNIEVINTAKQMIMRTLEVMKS